MPSTDAAGCNSTSCANATLRGKFVRALMPEADAYRVHSPLFGLFHALAKADFRPSIGGPT